MQNYSVLAKYYDKFTQNDCDYVSWSQYLYGVAKSHSACEVVDVACGTGKMTKLLAESGLRVTGVDASSDMLANARQKCKATFVLQDMRKLTLTHKFEMACCVNDGVNYLKPSELVPFFKAVASNLKDGAPFVFDVSSEYKLSYVVGSNVFYWDDEQETLLWTNALKDGRVDMNLTLFENDGNGSYRRFDERHTEYLHTNEQIVEALQLAGFELVEVTSDYGKQLTPTSLRNTFYALKTKQ